MFVASAVSDTHDSSTKPGIGARVDTPDTNQLSEKEKALVRVEWLKALAGQLLQEASELEAKWGSAVSFRRCHSLWNLC